MRREDGRAKTALRNIKITPDYMKFADGSCFIEMGDTKIICTASVEENVPLFLKGKDSGWITAEYGMLPRSCETRILRESSRGKVGGRTQEIQRLIGRALRAVVDLERLGERTIWIDADVIQGDGGTRCASINGSFVALVLALKRLKNYGVVNTVPVKDYVAAVSVGIVGREELLDLTYKEDSKASVDMNVVMTGKGKLVEIQGTAEKAPFSITQLGSLIELAKKGLKKIFEVERKIIGIDF